MMTGRGGSGRGQGRKKKDNYGRLMRFKMSGVNGVLWLMSLSPEARGRILLEKAANAHVFEFEYRKKVDTKKQKIGKYVLVRTPTMEDFKSILELSPGARGWVIENVMGSVRCL